MDVEIYECLICCRESIIGTSLNADYAESLCRLLRCSTYSDLIKLASFCESCILSVRDIGQLFADIRKLELKLEDWTILVQEQLSRGFEVANSKIKAIKPPDEDPFSANQSFRENVLSQLSRGLPVPTRYSSYESVTSSTLVHRNCVREISTSEVVPLSTSENSIWTPDEIIGPYGPPSPTLSFSSAQSFEEKYVTSFDESDVLNTDSSKAVTTKEPVSAKRSNCPPGLDKDTKNAKKPRGKTEKRITKDYSTICAKTFTNSQRLKRHARSHKVAEERRETDFLYEGTVPGNLDVANTITEDITRNSYHSARPIISLSEFNLKIASSQFPKVVLARLEDEDIVTGSCTSTGVQIDGDIYRNYGGANCTSSTGTSGDSEQFNVVPDPDFPDESVSGMRIEIKDQMAKKSVSKMNRNQRDVTSEKLGRRKRGRHIYKSKSESRRIRAHILGNHEGAKKCHRCETCDLSLPNITKWRAHMHEKHKTPIYTCKYCQTDSGDRRSLRLHVLSVHKPEKMHKCSFCSKIFSFKYKLEVHLRFHTKERPFICEICSESFKYSENLNLHQRSHHDGAFKCNECGGKQFSSPASLRNHIKRMHAKAYNIICELCGHGVLTKSALATHMANKHSEDRNFKCHLCPKSFKIPGSLRVHLRRHADIRSFHCKWCGKGFVEKNGLRRHELIHSKAECHECKVCGKTFPVRNYLYIHMRSHNKTKTNRKSQTSKKVNNNVSTDPNPGAGIAQLEVTAAADVDGTQNNVAFELSNVSFEYQNADFGSSIQI